MLGITRPKRPQPFDADLYRAAVVRLKQIMQESADPDARADALALLTDMGVVRHVGWRSCLRCCRPFFSADVARDRMCDPRKEAI